jgi:hypothetical protein
VIREAPGSASSSALERSERARVPSCTCVRSARLASFRAYSGSRVTLILRLRSATFKGYTEGHTAYTNRIETFPPSWQSGGRQRKLRDQSHLRSAAPPQISLAETVSSAPGWIRTSDRRIRSLAGRCPGRRIPSHRLDPDQGVRLGSLESGTKFGTKLFDDCTPTPDESSRRSVPVPYSYRERSLRKSFIRRTR